MSEYERASAVIGVQDEQLFVRGGQVQNQVQKRLSVIEGPTSDVQGIASAGEEATVVTVELEEPIGERGALALWIRPQAEYRNGQGQETIEHQLLKIPWISQLVFEQTPSACKLTWAWDESAVEGVDAMRTNVSELPGPEWYHLLYTWDASQGRFDAYLNGTPQRLPGTEVAPWSMEPGREISLHVGPFQFAEVSIRQTYIPPERARALDLEGYRGRRKHLLGRMGDREAISTESRLGALLYQSPLGSQESVDGWLMEGPGLLDFEDGWMRMSSERPEGPNGHIVHWCSEDFPGSFVAEWEVKPVSEYGLCIAFFCARGENGEDIFDPELPERNGIFRQYTRGSIVSYHISYYANTPFNPGRIASHLRKNNQFYLMTNGPAGISPGSTEAHQARLIKDGGHIQFLVDGRVIIDFVEDEERYGPVLGAGKIGLRQMQWMTARYRNMRVWSLRPS